jgi:hypothetical protein
MPVPLHPQKPADRQARPAAGAQGQAQAPEQAVHAGPHPARPLSRADVLRLQRTVGNRAVARLLQARRGPPPGVQRAIGFEFETPWDIRKPEDVEWDTDSTLVRGASWKMSPDEIGEEDNSGRIEFKTEPVEVDGEVQTVVNAAKALFGNLAEYTTQLASVSDGDKLPNAEAAFQDVTVHPNGELTAKPQVTGGVRTDLVLKLLADMSRPREKGDLMPNEAKKGLLKGNLGRVKGKVDQDSKAEREYWGTVSLLAYYIQIAHYAYAEAQKEWKELKDSLNDRAKVVQENEALGEEARTVELAKLKKEGEEGKAEIIKRYRPKYAKATASALPRVRFRTLGGITRDTLLKDVLETAGLTEDDGDKLVFPLGLGVDEELHETIAEWIGGIQGEEVDADLEDAEFWGEREIASGDVGSGGERGAAILLELRGLSGGLAHGDWFKFAKPFFEYFRELNTTGKPANE